MQCVKFVSRNRYRSTFALRAVCICDYGINSTRFMARNFATKNKGQFAAVNQHNKNNAAEQKSESVNQEEEQRMMTEEELLLHKNKIKDEAHNLISRQKMSNAYSVLYEWYNFVHLNLKKEQYNETLYEKDVRHLLMDAILLGYYGQCLSSYEKKEKALLAIPMFEECFALLDRFKEIESKAENEEKEKIRSYLNNEQRRRDLQNVEFSFCCSAGFLFIRFNQYEIGEKYLMRAIPLNKDHTFIYYRLALYNKEKGNVERAEKYYELTIKELNNPTLIGDFACFCMTHMKKYEKAEELFERALKMNPTHAENLYNYAVYHFEIAKNRDKAIELLQRAITDKAVDPRPASLLGSIWLIMNEYEKARQCFLKAKSMGGYMTYRELTHYAVAEAYCGNCDVAKETYEQALKLHDSEKPLREKHGLPDDSDLLGNYAELLFKVYKRYTDARNLFERAVNADPNNTVALNGYALLMAKLQDYDKAEALFKRSILINEEPENMSRLKSNLASYANFLCNQKRAPSEAAPYYQRIKKLIDESPEAQENEQLLEEYQKFISKHPELK